MGVQFVHMGAEDRARLHRFVKELAQDHGLETVPVPASWFERGPLPLDSGEIKTHHELFALLNKIYSRDSPASFSSSSAAWSASSFRRWPARFRHQQRPQTASAK